MMKLFTPSVSSLSSWSLGDSTYRRLRLMLNPPTTLASLIVKHESKSLGHLYGTICYKLENAATSYLPWAVESRASYTTLSCTGRSLDADLVVQSTTLDQDFSVHVGHDVKFLISLAASLDALAPCMACLQVPNLNAPTRPSNTKGHL
jgi:hypothetical protein